MGVVEPSAEGLARFAESPGCEGPVVMVNVNRYREHAVYPEGSPHAACSGREAYARYGAGVAPLLAKHGARVIYFGAASPGPVIADGEDWDEVMLVEYPRRQAFLDMVSSAEYQAVVEHRRAGIEDSRVIETAPADLGTG